MSHYLVDVTLPTKGLLYPEELGIGDTIQLRSMTTSDEKILYGSTSAKAVDKVLEACVMNIPNFKSENLYLPDKHYLTMKLRTHTFGSDYTVSYKCDECGETHEYTVNIDELPVEYLDDDFQQPFEVGPMPRSGDTLTLKIVTGKDLDDVEKEVKRLRKTRPNMKDDPSYILRMMKYLVTVNGEELPKGEKQRYIETMQGMDSAFFWDSLDKIRFGIDTVIDEVCPSCEADLTFPLPVSSEFFRPKFK